MVLFTLVTVCCKLHVAGALGPASLRLPSRNLVAGNAKRVSTQQVKECCDEYIPKHDDCLL